VGGKISNWTCGFNVMRRNIEKTQILHPQGFDVHISDVLIHFHKEEITRVWRV
jgi:hypothetical protein